MKRYTSAVAMFLLFGSSVAFAANGNGTANTEAAGPQPQTQQQNMYSESDTLFGKPAIAADGIQNSTQVDNPSDIGGGSSTAVSPEPLPTEGDVGVQNAK